MADGGRWLVVSGRVPGDFGRRRAARQWQTGRMLAALRRHPLSEQAVAWILAALVFRALVPAGFMVGTGADHSLEVELCHGQGQFSTVVHYGDDGRPLDAPADPHRAKDRCPFALSALLAPPPVIAAPAASSTAAALDWPPVVRSVDLPERDRRPGARAPPRFT